jgi:hypothetical protein
MTPQATNRREGGLTSCRSRSRKFGRVPGQGVVVADSGEGVCVDPGEEGAILGTGGPGPPERGKGRQLAPDSGGEGT